jgi:4-hydroxy-tetrahydrodipicolinate synthase
MKKIVFRGVATALVTPFENGEIDFAALGRLIDMQVDSGVSAIVIAGTTGESSTLSEDERIRLFGFAAERICGRVPLILGTGSNDTKTAVKYTKIAERMGASASLSVTPYYNKGTERGIIEHYKRIAEATELPTILYNVPSRTGVNLSLFAIDELSAYENVVGIKEASDSLDRLTALSTLSERITLYSGNDSQIYPMLALGGAGVISVASNIIPRTLAELTERYFSADLTGALALQKKLLPFISALFTETNPTPIKYAMSLRGLCKSEVRLPLAEPQESSAKKIKEALDIYRDLL